MCSALGGRSVSETGSLVEIFVVLLTPYFFRARQVVGEATQDSRPASSVGEGSSVKRRA